MGTITYEDPPPPRDVQKWLQLIATNGLGKIRPETLVAAAQDLDPIAGNKAREAIALHLSDVIYAMVGPNVRKSYANQGKDIVERVHGQIIEAIFEPESADGRGLREAFGRRVDLRLKDALRSEIRAKKRGGVGAGQEAASLEAENGDRQTQDPADADWLNNRESVEVEDALMLIKDDLKRMAFRLHMDGIPCKSVKGPSIANAVGHSERTVRTWIEEITKFLKEKLGEAYE